jgi:two-component system cell cycle response regulator
MLDLDDFKLVNDTFGHLLGDGVLAWTAKLIRATLRASDVAARYGGDEFAVLLPDTDRAGAMATAERILAAFREHPFQADARGPVPLAVSIGVASYPDDALAGTALIEAADSALYRSKRHGGDGASLATGPTGEGNEPNGRVGRSRGVAADASARPAAQRGSHAIPGRTAPGRG